MSSILLRSIIAASHRRLDSDVAAFRTATGATDILGINDLAKYLKAESLWASSRVFPFKAAQNFGSGSTVQGLGGITSNHATLYNSPTWGASGLALNGTNQHGLISDFLASETLTIFLRAQLTSGAGSTYPVSQYDAAANRSLALQNNGSLAKYQIVRSLDGGITNWEGQTYGPRNASDVCHIVQAADGGAVAAWINSTAQTLTLNFGSAQTGRLNTSAAIGIGCILSSGVATGFEAGTFTAAAFVTGAITSTQRDAISTLILAL